MQSDENISGACEIKFKFLKRYSCPYIIKVPRQTAPLLSPLPNPPQPES